MGMSIDTVTKWLGIIRANLKVFPEVSSSKKIEALDTAISYLEDYQHISTTKNDLGVDCINRAEVNQVIEDYIDEQYHVLSDRTRERAHGAKIVGVRINELSSVTPQEPRKGHWIKSRDSYGNNHFTCPFCEHDIATKADTWEDNYCSNCGADMREEEE